MDLDALAASAAGPWGLVVMMLLVLGDAFFVVVPGEIAVTAMGSLAVDTGRPHLWAVILCATAAAALGDILCYAIGRWVGLERWTWMRGPRIQRARHWARGRLEARTALALFTARFIPFARLAVNLVAGATRVPLDRYAGIVLLAAAGWAGYQATVGALFAAVLPGGPVVAILVSVVVAMTLGAFIDLLLNRRSSARDQERKVCPVSRS